jgi:deoxycytidylate deaminase
MIDYVSRQTKRAEIFIGLIAPIGVDLEAVANSLSDAFKSIHYLSEQIRLTEFFKFGPELFESPSTSSPIDRYERFIKNGNLLRKQTQRNDIFALIAASLIHQKHQAVGDEHPSKRTAYIIRQFKRKEEVDTLRQIYGENIVFISCHAPRQVRIRKLRDKIASSEATISRTELESKALHLIATDENESNILEGQRVSEAYPEADYILDCTDDKRLKTSVDRFTRSFFGDPFITPNADEYGMYIAKSASLRSSDLSRQVGAAIFGVNHEIISMGCNEVPKFGGGTYWTEDENDHRDFRLGRDPNQKIKSDMVRDVLEKLKEADWFDPEYKSKSAEELFQLATKNDGGEKGPLTNAKINDILEFGRVIHAEMNAITDAARFRRSTSESTLYCTTLPCHICTRHIIASGIKRVSYIEPYDKSLIGELYPDSVFLAEIDAPVSGRVIIEPFVGVTPESFQKVFKRGKRKDKNGNIQLWDQSNAAPTFLTVSSIYANNEKLAAAELLKLCEEKLGISTNLDC